MQFARIVELANATPTAVLCDAWAAAPEYVDARKREESPLSIREAGSLAELHGMNLLDVLAL